jgi:UDP-GlcNAc:undecaprenyl-phosphate GlcNAc-1-phosphate transferase
LRYYFSFHFLVAAGLSFVITPIVRSLARRRGVVEESGQRPHAAPIPTLGGLAVLAASAVAIALSLVVYPELTTFLAIQLHAWRWTAAGAVLIATLGVIDDIVRVRPPTKIVFQTIAALLVVADGHGIGRVINPFTGETLYLGWLAAPVTLFWIIGITNAFNLIDGLDGLAAGIGLIAALTLAEVAVLAGRPDIVLIALTLAGALGGFLYYNYAPASIFMGDSGSMFVGFAVAALYVRGAQQPEGVPLLTPILALSVPIADTLLAILRRGVWPATNGGEEPRGVSKRLLAIFRRDREHVHHRLISMGLKEAHAVLILYGVSLFSAVVAVLTFQSPAARLTAVAMLVTAVFVLGLRRLR